MDTPTMKKKIQLAALLNIQNAVQTDEYIANILDIDIDPIKGIKDSDRGRFRKTVNDMLRKAQLAVLR